MLSSLLLLFIVIIITITIIVTIIVIVIIIITVIVTIMSAESSLVAGKLGPSGKGVEGLQLVWPTVQEIRDSVEGWRGGASVPGPSKNVNKPFLQPYWHRSAPLYVLLNPLSILHRMKSC